MHFICDASYFATLGSDSAKLIDKIPAEVAAVTTIDAVGS